MGIVGESVVKVGEDVINLEVNQTLQMEEDIQVWFQKDFSGSLHIHH